MRCPLIKEQTSGDKEFEQQICLHCPYIVCAQEVTYKKDLKLKSLEDRNKTICVMAYLGLSKPKIAKRFGLGTRHIWRIVNGK